MLVSPGLEVTVSDDAQYAPSAVATVPLVIFASAQDKVVNGVVAPGTQTALAGALQAVTSQRELVTTFGQPTFYQTTAGTPINGHELNEYGLQAAYSALGLTNRAYMLRADIDTSAIEGSANRPTAAPENGTYWLDTADTKWGLNEWDATAQTFSDVTPLLITEAADVTLVGDIYYPVDSVGQIGNYAVVLLQTDNYMFYKRYDNVWTLLGSNAWKVSHPAVTGSTINPTFSAEDSFYINGVLVTIAGTAPATATLATVINNINAANVPGVTARVITNRLALYVNGLAKSNGSVVDGKMIISQVTGTAFEDAGFPLDAVDALIVNYSQPEVSVSSFAAIPDWRSFDTVPHPTGSVWVKTSVIGGGIDFVIKKYNAESASWTSLATPVYSSETNATNGFDPLVGGIGIEEGSLYINVAYTAGGISYAPNVRTTQGQTVIVGDAVTVGRTFTPGEYFRLGWSILGTDTLSETTVVATSTTPESIIGNILAANIPEIDASWNSTTRTVTLTHVLGGTILLSDTDSAGVSHGTILADLGFTVNTVGVDYNSDERAMIVSNFDRLTYTYSDTQPYTVPADGTLWYYNTPLEVDIMVNSTTGWKGYRTVSSDARGYNLTNTDPAGVIMSPTAPTLQSDGTALVAGDLWLDTGDLENFPALYRRNAASPARWVAIDKADQITQEGILFADARWDTDGTKDPISDTKSTIAELLASNYLDLDAPDYRLSPRGMLLFNMRRSGFNVKRFVENYYNDTTFPLPAVLPTEKNAWVTTSGLQNDGSMYAGHRAQRAMVVEALKAAVDTNQAIRESAFAFNLIVCPGYPELISNMVALNNDRKNTAFVIGDTPMTLATNITPITNWVNNTYGDGLTTSDPYLGVYYPSGLSNDTAGNPIVVPASHVMLRTMIRNDIVSFPWFAPAGLRRGLIDNVSDIGVVNLQTGEWTRNGINQGMRDALYSIGVNPLTILPGAGPVVFGQKTRNPTSSAMDRVNVARLVNYVRTVLAHIGDGFLFEPNDAQTRREFKAVVQSIFTDLVTKRGIYDFLVVCDESNNTADRIARNELYCDVFIEPVKAVEFIYIPVRLKNPGTIAGG